MGRLGIKDIQIYLEFNSGYMEPKDWVLKERDIFDCVFAQYGKVRVRDINCVNLLDGDAPSDAFVIVLSVLEQLRKFFYDESNKYRDEEDKFSNLIHNTQVIYENEKSYEKLLKSLVEDLNCKSDDKIYKELLDANIVFDDISDSSTLTSNSNKVKLSGFSRYEYVPIDICKECYDKLSKITKDKNIVCPYYVKLADGNGNIIAKCVCPETREIDECSCKGNRNNCSVLQK